MPEAAAALKGDKKASGLRYLLQFFVLIDIILL
jgi:hypothetical protein